MSFLFPQTEPPGQEIGALDIGSSSYGQSIPYVFGSMRVPGSMMWVGNPFLHSNEQDVGSKGGGGSTQTTYTYSCSFAVMFCQGPIFGVRKIWAENKIIYDVSDTASQDTLNASAALAARMSIYTGTETQLQDSEMVAKDGAGATPAYRGIAYILFEDMDLSPYNNRLPGITAEVVSNGHYIGSGQIVRDIASLSSVIERLALSANLTVAGADIDTSDLTADLRGAMIDADKIRDTVSDLLEVYNANAAVFGRTLKFYDLEREIDTVIDAQDLGAADPGQNGYEQIRISRKSEYDLPKMVRLTARNFDADYNNVTQNAQRSQSRSYQRADKSYDHIVFTTAGLATAADKALWRKWTERTEFEFTLSAKYLRLLPGNIINIPIGSSSYTVRLTSVTVGANLQIQCKGVLHNSNARSVSGSAVAGTSSVQDAGTTVWTLLNLPPLIDAHALAPGVYVAATGASNGWLTGTLYRSLDSGANWSALSTIQNFCIMGTAALALPDGQTFTWDESYYLDVVIAKGTLSSKTDDQVLAGANAFAIGSAAIGWEVVQAATVTLVGTNTYRLTRWLRGRRATEWMTALHSTAETVVYLATVSFVSIQYANLNSAQQWKVVPNGHTIADESAYTYTVTGENMVPFSPVDLLSTKTLDGSGNPDLVFTWVRRSRLGMVLTSGQEIPLGETSEQYHVKIFNASNVLVREAYVSTTTYSYDHTLRAADLGSPTASMVGFSLKIFQVSSNVGDGRQGMLTFDSSNS